MRIDGKRQRLGTALALLVLGACALVVSLYLVTSQVMSSNGRACGTVTSPVDFGYAGGDVSKLCEDARASRTIWAFADGLVGLAVFSLGVRHLNLIGELLLPQEEERSAG